MRRLLRPLFALTAVVATVAACSTSSPTPERSAQVNETCDDYTKDTVEKVITAVDGDAKLDMKTVTSPKAGTIEQHVTVSIAGKTVYRSDGVANAARISVIGKYVGTVPEKDIVVAYESPDRRTGTLTIGASKFDVDLEAIKADPTSFAKKLPNVVDPAIMGRIAGVFGKLNGDAPDSCSAAPTPGIGTKSEPGHTSNPGASGECRSCRFRCDVGYAACATIGFYGCMKGCAVLLPLWPAGPVLYSACILTCGVVVLLSCDAARKACIDTCKDDCCPVTCGTACCDEGESCLDAPRGLCCSPHLAPCPGATPSCFDPRTEVCNPGGKACPIDQDCGDKCCPSFTSTNTGTTIKTICVDPVNTVCCPQGKALCRPLDPVSTDDVGVCCAAGFCVRGQCLGSPSTPIPAGDGGTIPTGG